MLKLVMGILRGELSVPLQGHENTGFYYVNKFVEKPNRETAELYMTSGNHYWNSGIFMFKASVYLEELRKFRPDIYNVCEQVASSSYIDLDFIRLSKEQFQDCPAESIDFAVMEKQKNVLYALLILVGVTLDLGNRYGTLV